MILTQRQGFVTACLDGSVRHWDREGRLRARIHGHKYLVMRVDGSEDGKWLATGSDDGTVRFWPLDRDDMVRLAGDRLPRDFTPEERERFGGLLQM